MANELTTSISLNYAKGNVSARVEAVKQVDVATERALDVTQVIGTSEEQAALVDVASVKRFYVRNLDDTNFVEVGVATGVYPIKLAPGEDALFQPNVNALFLKADTAACLVRIVAVNA